MKSGLLFPWLVAVIIYGVFLLAGGKICQIKVSSSSPIAICGVWARL